mgnify:CR=1 FL=1
MSFSGTLSGEDWPYLFLENIKEFSFFPTAGSLWLVFYYQATSKLFVEYFGLNWEIAERILWFWPFLILSIISSYYLTKSWIGVLIYTTNTYILMVVSGGQMGVALAYSIAPLVIGRFIKLINSTTFLLSQNFKFQISNFKYPIIAGLIFGIQTMFDPRISYIIFIAVIFYFLFTLKKSLATFLSSLLFVLLIPILIMIVINLYWILPLLYGNIPIEHQGFKSVEGFKFLSFADFSHSISLLHPNWPENIFGKTYFLQPEFLILPIIAYFGLFFSRTKILFFSLIGLIGAFLAKGSNPPFEFINEWFFQYFPGMSMFRDSSKFYLLIVLGYSFLIPFALQKISKKIPFGKLLPVVFILFWCILIRHAFFGELGGTFKTMAVPTEYIELKQHLLSTPNSTILWIPSRQRFGFSSDSHPGISARDILEDSDPLRMAKVISNDKGKTIYNKFKEMKIEQIIVPYDSDKELFILDRKYNDLLRDKVIIELDKTEWLIKIPKFSKSAIYKVQ